MVVIGVACYLALLLGLVGAFVLGTQLGVRAFGVPDFAWFDSRTANAPLLRRLGVRCAGVLGAYLFCGLLSSVGLHIAGRVEPTTTVKVLEGPARRAGMKDGDRVLAIDGVPIDNWDAIRAQILRKPGLETAVEVERAGVRLILRVTPTSEGRIAVATIEKQLPIGLAEAARHGFALPLEVLARTLRDLERQVRRDGERVEIVGAVGLIRETGAQAQLGAQLLTFLGALGAYLLAFLVGIQIFDACSLFLFRKTHPDAAQGERAMWRLARMQQALVLSLGSWVFLTALFVLQAAKVPTGLILPAVFLLSPAAFGVVPLAWIGAARFWGGARLVAMLLLGLLLPCCIAAIAVGLLLRVRRELRDKQFRVGLLVATPLTE